ncbi:MAG: hypothetical protein KBE16_00200 [Alphaproteobacteria bacterium]|jgi:hypothetical protein|nr:hypothetical protein [Alphaproteobacteria bacterium]MBP9876817.1 hypothetical protein [Alphaproteobacteria bacterium]
MPKEITNLPTSIIEPLDQMEPGKAKIKVMTADIHRRVLENQDMLAMVKDPKTLDKRESKKYSELQKSKDILDELLIKMGQLYVQKKDLKAKIPRLVKELETQKENFKIYKQKDKVAAAEKALKTAQKDYAQLRKELASLEQKIDKTQKLFNEKSSLLFKSTAPKTTPVTSVPFYPEATRQKIADLFKALPPEMRAKLADIHQDYENVMSDSPSFYDEILALLEKTSETVDLEPNPHIAALKTLIKAEKDEISSISARKEASEKILSERIDKQWQAYESSFSNRMRILNEIQIYKESEELYLVLRELQPLLVESVKLFSPRGSFYEDILALLTKAHPQSKPPSLMERMSILQGNNVSTLVQDVQDLIDAEKKYLATDLCAQKLRPKVENHYMNHLIQEDNRLHQEERLKTDQEVLSLFDQFLETVQNDPSTQFDQKLPAIQSIIIFRNAYNAAASPNPFYYKTVKGILETYFKDYKTNPLAMHMYDLRQEIDYLPHKGTFIKTNLEITTNELFLAPKIQREHAQLQLHHLKQENPNWAQNITFIEKSILPKLNKDQKQALKDLLKTYPVRNSPILIRIDYDPHLDQRLHDYLTEWSQTKNANPEALIVGLKDILSKYDYVVKTKWISGSKWLQEYTNSILLFEEDMPSGLPNPS